MVLQCFFSKCFIVFLMFFFLFYGLKLLLVCTGGSARLIAPVAPKAATTLFGVPKTRFLGIDKHLCFFIVHGV